MEEDTEEGVEVAEVGREVEDFKDVILEAMFGAPFNEARSLFGGGPIEPSTEERCGFEDVEVPSLLTGVGVPKVFTLALFIRTGFVAAFEMEGFSLDSL